MLSAQYKPYEIKVLEGQTQYEFVFSFTTDNNIDYIATFNKAEYRFNEECYQAFNVYDFSFYNVQNLGDFSDPRISSTIHKLLVYFMETNGHAIIYICDDADGKSEARDRLFKWWYRHFDNSQYQAYFTKIELPEYDTYVGIIALVGDSGFENYLRYLEIY
ncbi:DUF6169 family protein [Arcicella rigui]|uniref:DUF6169 family protein n=1 Tax=Arcicella rigui TaxID=797020 RepID=A0ABU5QB80_9BACT|nr:DUF6169 family protein [Arcicella rigui]MEA5139614.1 DUF6169 family protein [Arcicella rigui]